MELCLLTDDTYVTCIHDAIQSQVNAAATAAKVKPEQG